MKHTTKAIQNLAHGLTILSFILVSWVGHRMLQPRSECVSSSYISFVQVGSTRVENCAYQSRLSLASWLQPLTKDEKDSVRALEILEPLTDLFPGFKPRLAVQITEQHPRLFEIGRGYIRLGSQWLQDPLQTERALIMGLLKRDQPQAYGNPFELEVMTDFIVMTVMKKDDWPARQAAREIKFPTASPSFAAYCKSQFRSLAHYAACASPEPDSVDLQSNVWGYRPLLAAGLVRVYSHLSLHDQLAMMAAIREGVETPMIRPLRDQTVPSLVEWFSNTLEQHLIAFHLPVDIEYKRTLKELEVEAPTRWELTVDITHTPAWKEILEQLKTYAHFRTKERTLVFTPQGAVALPADVPVAWNKDDISSQTHVMIACDWPKPEEALNITSRHLFARQSCTKVDKVFWN